MNKKFISVKTVVAIGIGAALMFVLMRFVAIPSGVPNTNLNLGIAILAFFAAIFGPIAGLLIGFIGHFLTDLTWGWGVWWSWVICSALVGLIIGLFWKLYKIEAGGFGLKQCFIFNGIQIAANAVVWGYIAPTLDILIYQEPAEKVFLQGAVAGALNIAIVLVLGSLLAFGYTKLRIKPGSLKAE
jgi:energy-coupling factor transport system substrate-specific component